MISVNQLRQTFLDYFARAGHTVVPSGSLVPHNDPTLMFTAAGMVPFKNVFTGVEKRSYVRAASSQKCVRAGGKHNDLDNVGYTARHHTFFEMLGNFSFGDYFKERAIELAWNFLTKELKLPVEKLLVTVYHTDDEAFNLWKRIAGLPDEKIIRIASSDNFWAAGDTGPCGPCSEIFYDHGPEIPGGPPGSAEADGDRFIEIWNLVFMQYDQQTKDSRVNLPKPSIDTGMGLERLSAVLQGVHDNYDIDLFRALIAASERESGNDAPESRVSHRVIADHLRSSAFLMADGVMPSNEGRGYVLRRIMRRAMRHAHLLGCVQPLMHRLVPALVHEMGEAYPELKRAQALTTETFRLEEERFRQTLGRGIKLLEEEVRKIPLEDGIKLLKNEVKKIKMPRKMYTSDSMREPMENHREELSGEVAFKLYDTYGFPLDLTQDILRAQNITVDLAGFEKAMNEQKERARAAWTGSGDKATGRIWFDIKDRVNATEFLGYTDHDMAAKLVAIVVDGAEVSEARAGTEATLVFNQTPFYGESGGQIGDTGTIRLNGETVAEVSDTQKPLDDFLIHKVKLLASVKTGDALMLHVDKDRRDRIRANHSATHILHAVLRRQLGEHVTQKGSLVAPDRLRFDVSHPKALTREEIAAVEREVNRVIWQNQPVTTRLMTPDAAVGQGAMALFGEKYGDEVRVVSMGAGDGHSYYSTELCGGTHVSATGDIGLFKIVSEAAVAAGIRRIEAVTRDGAFAYLSEQDARMRDLALQLKAQPGEVTDKVAALVSDRKKLEKELSDARRALSLGGGGAAEAKVEMIGDIAFSARGFADLDPKELRGVADETLKTAQVAVITTALDGKASLVVAVSPALAGRLSAVALVQAAVAVLGGKGGGGRPEMAQGGGPDTAKIDEAVAVIRGMISG